VQEVRQWQEANRKYDCVQTEVEVFIDGDNGRADGPELLNLADIS
jgi:hypothetical protein